MPVEEMDISELRWILDIPFWEDAEGNIVIVPNDVIRNPNKYPEHHDKMQNSDTSYPLDIMRNKNGK